MQTNLIRSLKQVLEDGLYPTTGGIGDTDQYESLRHQVLAEVLCRIPQSDYNKLKKLAESFYYFIPHIKSRGEVYPFPTTISSQEIPGTKQSFKSYSKVLFLSPI